MTTESAPPAQTASAAQAEARSLRKTRVGVVVSAKMDKTVVVEVVRRVPHPKFKKMVKRTSKVYAHDEKRESREGQVVRIMECRPLSKLKRWRVVEWLGQSAAATAPTPVEGGE
jgi:small subunit ribosomal protein S17